MRGLSSHRFFSTFAICFALAATSGCSTERTYQDLTVEQRAGQPGQIIATIESDPGWKNRDALRSLHGVAMKAVDKPGEYVFISKELANGLQLMCPEVGDMPSICRNRIIHAFGWTDYPVTLGYPEAVRAKHARKMRGT